MKDTVVNALTVRDAYFIAFLPAILAEAYRQAALQPSDGTWEVPELAMKTAFECAEKALIERSKK